MIEGPPPEQTTNWRQPSSSTGVRAGERGELARLVIIARLVAQPPGDRALRLGDGGIDEHVRPLGRGDARRTVEDEGGSDPRLVQQQLGLEQLELEAHRPQILAQQELHVLKGELDRRDRSSAGTVWRRGRWRHRRWPAGICAWEALVRSCLLVARPLLRFRGNAPTGNRAPGPCRNADDRGAARSRPARARPRSAGTPPCGPRAGSCGRSRPARSNRPSP